jgi:hypothetical protein
MNSGEFGKIKNSITLESLKDKVQRLISSISLYTSYILYQEHK